MLLLRKNPCPLTNTHQDKGRNEDANMKTIPELAQELGIGEHEIRRLFTGQLLPEPTRLRGTRVVDSATEADIRAALVARGKLLPTSEVAS